jgi:RNA polymerase sigma-70 factor (ECF subfamily)
LGSPGSRDAFWADCIRRAGRGEQQGLAELYDHTNRLVYGVALRMAGNPADAEEITLDVYSQVWRLAKDYTPERGSPTAWLMMMTRSRALDRVRSRTARSQHETVLETTYDQPAAGQTAEESAMLTQDRRRVRQAMGLLSAEQREAIELAFFSGLTHSELAERLGQPLGTVKTRIRLGMMRLRSALTGPPGAAASAAGEVV